jgi:acyl dehydratase
MTKTDAVIDDVWAATAGGRPAVGTAAERSRWTSMQDVEMFTAMTGDRNPLHWRAGRRLAA